MSKIHIVTDSTADLKPEVIEKYNLHVVPLSIQIGGQTYLDRVDLEPKAFLDLMKNTPELPKSSQPAPGVFKELYDRLGQNGDQVLSIHMTGGMSGTVESARTAAELTDTDVTVIDSRYISHALAFQVFEAADMAKQGKPMEEIVARVHQIRENSKLYVVVDTLDNLVKGGRIGKGRAMLGSFLKIKPIASLDGGEYTPVAKVRSYKQVVQYLMDDFKERTAGKLVKGIGIAHADGLSIADPLKKQLQEAGYTDIRMDFTTPVISTHTGIGAIGFMFYTD
ncbi:DegV family protein [Planococcus shenhongbingii]|uniref:DegV family protein n=1 Tax=Planococcus shenhongbingii TaxID=3058398 RepID=A0ABT8N7V3_9BACL|nr:MULTISPECIES: DegV family protein [unclassified Planococcus (in: firmicutes)]MDN7243959.1 DegV family protein [Planococcus sp. N017]WKA57136.1 DegV family protein [Planococcus sp. N016]